MSKASKKGKLLAWLFVLEFIFIAVWSAAGAFVGRSEYDFFNPHFMDLDSNGNLDVLDWSNSGSLKFYRNDGNGNFELKGEEHLQGTMYVGLAEDLDGDGFSELLVDSKNDVYLVSIDGWHLEKREMTSMVSSAGDAEATDLDGDGIQEVCYGTMVYKMTDGQYVPFGVDYSKYSTLCADLTGGGRDELVAIPTNSATINVYSFLDGVQYKVLSTRITGMTKPLVVDTKNSIVIADGRTLQNGQAVLLDSRKVNSTAGLPVKWSPDIGALDNFVEARVGRALYFDGEYRVGNVTVLNLASMPGRVVDKKSQADFNSDGFPDSVYAIGAGSVSRTQSKVSVWLSDASGPVFMFRVINMTAGAWAIPYAADIDNDGDLDLLTLNYCEDDVSVFLNMGGSFGPRKDYQLMDPGGSYMEATPDSMEFADLDGDGSLDIVAGGYNGRVICVINGDGKGGFGLPKVHPAFPGKPFVFDLLHLERVDDLTGDGHQDIVFTCGKTVLLQNDGRGGFPAAPEPLPMTLLVAGFLYLAVAPIMMRPSESVHYEGMTPGMFLRQLTTGIPFGMMISVMIITMFYFMTSIAVIQSIFGLTIIGIVISVGVAFGAAAPILGRSKEPLESGKDELKQCQRRARGLFLASHIAGIAFLVLFVLLNNLGSWTTIISVGVSFLAVSLVLTATALWLRGWRRVVAAFERTLVKKEWTIADDSYFEADEKLGDLFESAQFGWGVKMFNGRSKMKGTILTVVEQGKESHVSLLKMDGDRFRPIKASALLEAVK